MTAAPPSHAFAIGLDELGVGIAARVTEIRWGELDDAERCRLGQFGFDEGVVVEALHLGPFGRDPLAVRVGRMTVALRRAHARAVRVVPLQS